jgi:hypothetical protein
MPGVEDLEWVSEQQQIQLAELTPQRGEWREWLPAEFDERWPEWRGSTEDVLAPWLDVVIGLLLTGGAETVETDDEQLAGGPASLDWVTAEQVTRLEQITGGGDWREWLVGNLDTTWPDWRYSDGETLTGWLGDWLSVPASAETADVAETETAETETAETETAEAQAEAASDEAEPPASDASDLTWVSTEQAARLDALTATRGDWRQWLPLALDELGEWRGSSRDALAVWLDAVIPTFEQPADAAATTADAESEPEPDEARAPLSDDFEPADEEQEEETEEQSSAEQPPLTAEQRAEADQIVTSVVSAVQDNPEMAEILAGLTPEQLTGILAEVAATRP